MNIKPIYEFLLWNNCNNNCKFCFQRSVKDRSTYQQQQLALQKTIDFIKSSNFIQGSHILLVGGELFDDKNRLFLNTFFQQIAEFVNTDIVDLVYLNTNLIYDRNCLKLLLDCVSLIPTNKLKFTTSYDLYGRFYEDKENQFLENLEVLSKDYRLNIVVNTILTDPCCTRILNGSFNPLEFAANFNVDINLIPYIVKDNSISAPKQKILGTLAHVGATNEDYLIKYIRNLDLNQRKLLYLYNNSIEDFCFCSCGISECGHSENFKKCYPEKTCFICDLKEIFNV